MMNVPPQREPRSHDQSKPAKPRMRHRSSSTSTLPTAPRHLQRTISSLINQKEGWKDPTPKYPPDQRGLSSSLPRSTSFASLTLPSYMSLPKTRLPTLPSFSNVPRPGLGNVRPFSASTRDDKSVWKTWWEGSGEGSAVLEDGSKRDDKALEHAHKHMLDDVDKADTLEEESARLKQKCTCD
jgi:hypothetical protein